MPCTLCNAWNRQRTRDSPLGSYLLPFGIRGCCRCCTRQCHYYNNNGGMFLRRNGNNNAFSLRKKKENCSGVSSKKSSTTAAGAISSASISGKTQKTTGKNSPPEVNIFFVYFTYFATFSLSIVPALAVCCAGCAVCVLVCELNGAMDFFSILLCVAFKFTYFQKHFSFVCSFVFTDVCDCVH